MTTAETEPTTETDEEPRRMTNARTCVGCGAKVAREARVDAGLVRLVLGPDGAIAVDAADSGFGRGAHVHGTAACVEKAARAGLPRVTRRSELTIVDDDGPAPLRPASLAKAIRLAMERRLAGLFASARRSRELSMGSESTQAALAKGQGALVVVAKDAAAAAELGEVRRAIADGLAVAWGSKSILGRVTGSPSDVGVVVFLSERFAREVRAAVFIIDALGSVGATREGPAPRAGARHRGASKAPDPGPKSPLPAGGRGSFWERGA